MKNRIKVLRAEHNMTQQDLGDLVGVSRHAIIALESEKHDPSLPLAYKIAAAFELPVEDVFENPYRK